MSRRPSSVAEEQSPLTETALVPAAAGGTLAQIAQTTDRSDLRGREAIGVEDILLPRIAVAQRTSPQIDPSQPEYIENLRLYQMFNTLTGEVYGNGPVTFVCLGMRKYAIEFDAQMNVVDRNVPLGDPRLDFGPNGEKPVATLFYEYHVMAPNGQLASLILKSTQIKTAKKLNGMIDYAGGPAWTVTFRVSSASKTAGGFTFAQFIITPAGATPPAVKALAEAQYARLVKANVSVDETPAGDAPDDDI